MLLVALSGAACAPAPAAPVQAPAAPTAPGPPAATAGAVASAVQPTAAAVVAPRPLEPMKVQIAVEASLYVPHFIAVDKGYYAEEGLEVEFVRMGGGAAVPALLSGEVEVGTSPASAMGAMLKGAPLKIIYTNADRPAYELWSTTPEVRSLADLPGKTVGVQNRGDGTEAAVRAVLIQHGMDPDGVAYVAIGLGAQRLGAVQAGSVAALVLAVADVAQLADVGVRGTRLSDIKNEVRMLFMGAVATDRELQQNRERVKRFLRATARGREYWKAYRDEAIDTLTRWNGLPRQANEADIDDARPTLTDDGTMQPDAARRDAEIRAQLLAMDPAEVPAVDQLYDYSIIQEIYRELQASGWRPTR